MSYRLKRVRRSPQVREDLWNFPGRPPTQSVVRSEVTDSNNLPGGVT
jgi:hypothetical protein